LGSIFENMAYIICERHGGSIAVMASPRLVQSMSKIEEKIPGASVVLFTFYIAKDIPMKLWILREELGNFENVVPESAQEIELEKNEWVLGLMKPICSYCFAEAVGN
jgi:hypothetical protein